VSLRFTQSILPAQLTIRPNTTPNTIKFADDTTVVGLITQNYETAYREEVRERAVWCQDKNLSLNVSKTKEIQEYAGQTRPH
jgi:aminopeptidase N